MAVPPIDGGGILITGASSGIGLALARLLAPSARALVLVARRAERLEELRSELSARNAGVRVIALACDVSDFGAVDRMLERAQAEAGPVDVLVNNAGLGDIGLFERTEWRKVAQLLAVNVASLTYLTHRLLPGMLERRRGGILNVSSGIGLTWLPGAAVYGGSKQYVSAFTESLRAELRGTGVVVSQLCPGPVATEFEQRAGNPTGMSVPGFLEISAEQCARVAVREFRRGKAIIVPGFWAGVLIAAGRLLPRGIARVIYRGIGGFLRRRPRATEAREPSIAGAPESPPASP